MSPRLEFEDAPDETIRFVAPETASYRISVLDEPSPNEGCGVSLWDYGDDRHYGPADCPAGGQTTEIDGFYAAGLSFADPVEVTAGDDVMFIDSCAYWADPDRGSYTIRLEQH